MKIPFVVLCFLSAIACGKNSEQVGPVKHYSLSGKIVALDSQHQVATINAAKIPNYMDAMTMDYPIESKDDFNSLKVGEAIIGTLEVAGDETYTLTQVKPAK